jgi:hypothetical protein
LKRNAPIPVTLINTRDSFAFDLKFIETKVNLGEGRENVLKKEYHFDPNIDFCYPDNFKKVLGMSLNTDMKNIENLKIGVTCYENFWSNKELDKIEKMVEKTEKQSLNDGFLPMTA